MKSWSNIQRLRDLCVLAAYEATHAPAVYLGKVFGLSGRHITRILARTETRVHQGRPKGETSCSDISPGKR